MVGCEVKEESPSDSDASSATDANEYMAAADMQVMRCQQDRFNFTQSPDQLGEQSSTVSAGLDACGRLHIEAALALSYTCLAHASLSHPKDKLLTETLM